MERDAILERLRGALEAALELGGRAQSFDEATPLLGAQPELDSMAVVTLLAELESRFDIVIEDDDIEGDTFATLGTLADFIERKLRAAIG